MNCYDSKHPVVITQDNYIALAIVSSWSVSCVLSNKVGESEGEGGGENDVDIIHTACDKQDYLLYIAY